MKLVLFVLNIKAARYNKKFRGRHTERLVLMHINISGENSEFYIKGVEKTHKNHH